MNVRQRGSTLSVLLVIGPAAWSVIHRQERPRVPVPARRHHVTASEMPVKLCVANIRGNSRLGRPTLRALSAI